MLNGTPYRHHELQVAETLEVVAVQQQNAQLRHRLEGELVREAGDVVMGQVQAD